MSSLCRNNERGICVKEHVCGFKALSQLAASLHMRHVGHLTAGRITAAAAIVDLARYCLMQADVEWKAATSNLRSFILTSLFTETAVMHANSH